MQNIFITGSNRGIGLEFTKQYLDMGKRVFAATRNPNQSPALHKLEELYPASLTLIKLEVTNQEEIDSSVTQIEDLGVGIDLLINNAGIIDKREGFGNLEMTSMKHVFETNTLAPVLLTQSFISLLKRGNRPLVVNISSGLGSITNTNGNSITYSASKTALNMFSHGISNQLKQMGITIIVLHPGWVQTDMGGSNARLTSQDSVSSMIKVIGGLKIKDAGRFLNYDGGEIPW